LEQSTGIGVRLVERGGLRNDLLIAEAGERLLNLPLLVAEVEIHGCTLAMVTDARLGIIRLAKEHVMAIKLKRRALLQMLGASAAGAFAWTSRAGAADDAVTIGWPNDIPSWDPNQRFTPDAQPI